MALRDCALDRGAHEILFADDVGSASTNLLCGQQSMPDQADNGHLADAKTTCGFAQDQFMPLRAFTFAIDWYVMRTAEVATRSCVAVPRDNQGDTAASIRMRLRRGWTDEARA